MEPHGVLPALPPIPPTRTETPLHAEACAQTGSLGPGLSGGSWTHTHTHRLEHSGRRPPPPWETGGQQRDAASVDSGARTEAGRPERLPYSPSQTRLVSSAHTEAHLGGQIEKRAPAGGPRPLPEISRCPPPWGPEGGGTDRPQRWEGGKPGGSGRQPGTRAQARLPGWTGGRGGPPAPQPPADAPSASPPCLPSPGRDLPVGTAHFFCLTSAASAGKLSAAVCKHPSPLRRAACQAPPADSLAGSRLAQAAWPGTGLLAPVTREGCPLLRSGSCRLTAGPRPPTYPLASSPGQPLQTREDGEPRGSEMLWEELQNSGETGGVGRDEKL